MSKDIILIILTLFLVPSILLSNDDKTIIEIDSLLELSKEHKFNVEIESAIEVAHLALEKSLKINYSQGKASSYLNLAQTLLYLGSYEKALDYLSLTEEEPFTLNNLFIIFEISRIRGQIFAYLKLEKQAIREFEKCIRITNQIESKSQSEYGLSLSYENLSVVYGRLDMPDSVFYYLSKNKELLESTDEALTFRSKVNMYSSFGKWHADKREYEVADDYFKKALYIAEGYKYPYISQTYIFMGDMEKSRDNDDSALVYYIKASENLEITKIQGEQSLVYQRLSELYDKLGLNDSARIYRDKQILIDKELSMNRENSVEKALQVFLKEEKKLRENQKKKILIIVSFSILFFTLIAILIFRKTRRNLLEKKEKLNIELTESIKEIEDKEKEAKALEKKINESFNEVIDLAKSGDSAFLKRFSEVYSDEMGKILRKHPNLTNSELTLSALIFLNFSTKDIASYTFVAHRSVQTKKSRLRKKLNLPAGTNLENYLQSLAKGQI